jgi:hypothetical protein
LLAEVPIPPTPDPYGFLRLPRNLPCHVLEFLLPPYIDDLPVALQVAHIRALLTLNVVEDFGAREIAVKCAVPRDPTPHGIIDQLETQLRVVFELLHCTGVPLLEPAPLERIMRSRRTHVVGDDKAVEELEIPR